MEAEKEKRPETDKEWARAAEKSWEKQKKFTEQLITEKEIWSKAKREKSCTVCVKQCVCDIEIEGIQTKMNFLPKCKTNSKSQFKLMPLYVYIAEKYFCIGTEKQEKLKAKK